MYNQMGATCSYRAALGPEMSIPPKKLLFGSKCVGDPYWPDQVPFTIVWVPIWHCQNIIWAPAVVVVPDATISVAFWRDTMRMRNSRRPSLNINCFFIFVYIVRQFDQV